MHQRQSGWRSLHARGAPANLRAVSIVPAFRPTAFLFYSTTPSTQPQRGLCVPHPSQQPSYPAPLMSLPRLLRAGPRPATCTVQFRVLSLPVLFEQVCPIRRFGRPISPGSPSISLPGLQDGRTVRGDWPEPLDVENEVSRPRRHRPEVLCGGADHDSGRDTRLRQGSRQPAVSARDGWRFPPSEVERGGTASSADGTLGPLRRDSLIGGRLRGPSVPGIPDQREPSVQLGWPHSRRRRHARGPDPRSQASCRIASPTATAP